METVTMVILCLIVSSVSLVAGIIIGTLRMGRSISGGSVGDLRIDRSDKNDRPMICLEIYDGFNVDIISKLKFVMLRVNVEDYIKD